MKNILPKTLCFAFILCLSFLNTAAQEEQINWEKDFKKARTLARETSRPMMLDFTAEWCKPCKMMDMQFWILPEVIQAVKPFVSVKIDYDNDKSSVNKYRVGAIPFVIFTDPLGNMITFRRGFGNKNARELNQIFEEMPKDFSALKNLYDAIDQKKDDGAALLQIADSYRNSKMIALSSEFYKRALKTNDIKKDLEKTERIIATLGANYYAIKADKDAIEYLSTYLKDYPSGKNREISLSMISICYANVGKPKDAVSHFELLKNEFPASKNIASVGKAIEAVKK